MPRKQIKPDIIMDLHGYTCEEAEDIITDTLRHARIKKFKTIEFITGTGTNSPQGKAILMPFTEKILEREGWYFIKHERGSFDVFLEYL